MGIKQSNNKNYIYDFNETIANDCYLIYKRKLNYFMVFNKPTISIEGYINKILYQDTKCICFTLDNPTTKNKRFWITNISPIYSKMKQLLEPMNEKVLYIMGTLDDFDENVNQYVGEIEIK